MERKKLHYFTSLNYKFRITNSSWNPCMLMVGNRTVASYQNGGLILSLEARKIKEQGKMPWWSLAVNKQFVSAESRKKHNQPPHNFCSSVGEMKPSSGPHLASHSPDSDWRNRSEVWGNSHASQKDIFLNLFF